MKVWLFDESQLEAALSAWLHNAGEGTLPIAPAPLVRAFLHSKAAVDHKLHMQIRPKVNVPLGDADIAAARHSNPAGQGEG